MKRLFILCMITTAAWTNGQEIYDFSEGNNMSDWYVVDDVVMGGRSEGDITINEENHLVFHGNVSLDNNGGFSSVRFQSERLPSHEYTKFKINLKGDGKMYQFRVRSRLNENHSYVLSFNTTGDWQIIDIPFKDMFPSWRGMKLDMPNYPGEEAEEFSFLIANKKNESFRLEIDRIWME